jgi:hypothetical protein
MRPQLLRLSSMIGVAVLIVTAALVLCSCGLDSGFNSIADFDVIVTIYDDQADFGAIETYAMPDTVAHLGVDDGSSVDRTYDQLILDKLAYELEAAGYVREADPEANGADVVVLAGVTSTEWEVWISYPWYNWGYWGDYSGYSYYYPPCPGCGGSYRFTTGSLLVIMEDRNAADPDEETIPVIWAAGLNGLLEGSIAGISSRISDGIEQAFVQSPYLEAD